MDIIIKQRIVGIIVLVALAVVILPVLFSGNAAVFHERLTSNIPEKPQFVIDLTEEQRLHDRLSQPEEKLSNNNNLALGQKTESFPLSEHITATAPVAVAKAPRLIATSPVTEQAPEFSANLAKSKPQQSSAKKAKPAPSTAQLPISANAKTSNANTTNVNTSNAATTNAATKAKTKLATSKAAAIKAKPENKPSKPTQIAALDSKFSASKGWMVQVASFRKSANATALQKKLARHGMTSQIEKNRSNNGMLYRVKVGPRTEKKAAHALQAKLEKIVKLDTILVRVP